MKTKKITEIAAQTYRNENYTKMWYCIDNIGNVKEKSGYSFYKLLKPLSHPNIGREGKGREGKTTQTIGRDKEKIKDKHKYGQTWTRQIKVSV